MAKKINNNPPPHVVNNIEQKQIDAIGARILHSKKLARYKALSTGADVLALAVPFVYLVFRLIAKGSSLQGLVENVWELLAAALFVVVILKMAYRWAEKVEEHSRLMGENISLITQASQLLHVPQPLSADTMNAFAWLADSIEKQDRSSLAKVSEVERRDTYREALKEFGGPGVACPICHASPFNFKKGSCQLCGNTPKRGAP